MICRSDSSLTPRRRSGRRLGQLSTADRKALFRLDRGRRTSFAEFRRQAFPGLFGHRKAERALARLRDAGAIEMSDSGAGFPDLSHIRRRRRAGRVTPRSRDAAAVYGMTG